MPIFKLILFLYLCGVLISGGLIYTLTSYGLLDTEGSTGSHNWTAKITAIFLSWITISVFICGIVKGIIISLRERR